MPKRKKKAAPEATEQVEKSVTNKVEREEGPVKLRPRGNPTRIQADVNVGEGETPNVEVLGYVCDCEDEAQQAEPGDRCVACGRHSYNPDLSDHYNKEAVRWSKVKKPVKARKNPNFV